MLTNQQLFNNICDSLRTYGNKYGSRHERGWGWCNPGNPNERCAIARFIQGNNELTICLNLSKEVDMFNIMNNPIVAYTTRLFDYQPEVCNNTNLLEKELMRMADVNKLHYVGVSKLETV